jgi:hypothetical protein
VANGSIAQLTRLAGRHPARSGPSGKLDAVRQARRRPARLDVGRLRKRRPSADITATKHRLAAGLNPAAGRLRESR